MCRKFRFIQFIFSQIKTSLKCTCHSYLLPCFVNLTLTCFFLVQKKYCNITFDIISFDNNDDFVISTSSSGLSIAYSSSSVSSSFKKTIFQSARQTVFFFSLFLSYLSVMTIKQSSAEIVVNNRLLPTKKLREFLI